MSSKDLISRAPVRLVKLKMDNCIRTFGTSPCLATGTKCFNTYFTCKYLTAYSDTPKTYNFVSTQTNVNELIKTAPTLNPVRPFVKSATIRETELSDEKTITSQATIDMLDAWDNDLDIDPYWSSRSYANVEAVKGTFWKKFIARNQNYKGRAVEIYDGFLGDAESSFTRTFAGTVKEIKKNNDGSFRIECADYLESLNDIKYPVDYGMKLAASMPAIFTARSDEEMTSLEAIDQDICIRKDFILNFINTQDAVNTGGALNGSYSFKMVWYNSDGLPFMSYERTVYVGYYELTGITTNSLELTWDSNGGASYMRFWMYERGSGRTYDKYIELYSGDLSLTLLGGETYADGVPPEEAGRYYQLNGTDHTILADWDTITYNPEITLDDASILSSIGATSGYLKIDKEFVYYESLFGNILSGIIRGVNATNTDGHELNSDVCIIVKRSPGNPFSHLLDLLELAKIPSTSISPRFASYRDAWTGISFSLLEVLKDMKLGDLYFNLVNSLDCYSWVNEKGEIDIKYKTDLTVARKINDSDTIIKDSVSIDLNDESRLTRLLIYYERDNKEEALDEPQAYARGMQSKDVDLEKVAFKEMTDKEMYFAWVSYAGNDKTAVDTYMEAITEAMVNRLKTAPILFDLSVEIKDMDLLTADILELTTDEVQDVYGAAITDVKYRIVKRSPDGDNRIKLTLEKCNG
jgi:hypothetical protein